MRSSVLSPAVLWLVVSLAAFPSWLVPLCAASGAGLLRPNTAPTLISANDTAAGAEKRRLHPGNVECVCDFDKVTECIETNSLPTLLIDIEDIRIGVIEELPDVPPNAAGVVARAFFGGDPNPVPETSPLVDSVTVEELPEGILGQGSVAGITTIQVLSFTAGSLGTYSVNILVGFNEGGTVRFARAESTNRSQSVRGRSSHWCSL
ncbi:unnamed protein product [Vitrella brassicaformis CCMP3155]|uniref:Uncharacterized protein n=1 Tax=Vitrella brassicaformis (strain CCMP3155) TaxID=1169540 RepID=A0A0G4GF83_VITBC|nr:unnamed protein product [Vitrella brassicaformis CCMP3155]|eukprot:CEM28200.1 unnamed protein product [Vitrella brassicaformis CCMP3155]